MSSRTVTLTQILPIPTGLRQVLLVGFGIVLLALSAKLKVYLGPIPFTLQTLVVLLIGASYGARLAVLTTTLYLGIGLAGMPIFAGTPVITGGYLVGFIAASYLVGLLAERGWDRNIGSTIAMMVIGNMLIYAFGIAHLIWGASLIAPALDTIFSLNSHIFPSMNAMEAIEKGMLPFYFTDSIKILIAVVLLPGTWALLGKRN